MKYLVPVGPIPRHPDTTFAPHRLCAHLVTCVHGVSRSLQWIAADALATLPPLTPAAAEQARAIVDAAYASIAAHPADTRMAYVFALLYHLHDHTPDTQPWRKLRDAIDRACKTHSCGERAVFAQDDAAEALYCALYPEAP